MILSFYRKIHLYTIEISLNRTFRIFHVLFCLVLPGAWPSKLYAPLFSLSTHHTFPQLLNCQEINFMPCSLLPNCTIRCSGLQCTVYNLHCAYVWTVWHRRIGKGVNHIFFLGTISLFQGLALILS